MPAASRPGLTTSLLLLVGLAVGALLPDRDAASVRPASVTRPAPRAPAGWHVWPPDKQAWAVTDGPRVTLATPPDGGPASVTACFDADADAYRTGRLEGTWDAQVPDDGRARVFVKTQVADRPAVATPVVATSRSVAGPVSAVFEVPDRATLIQLCVAAQGRGLRVALTVDAPAP